MALGKLTLLQLRTRIRNRCDMASSQFITDSELNDYINDSLYELYDLLIEKYGNRYYVATPSTIATDGTNYLYSLPSDFYKLIGVDLKTNSNTNPYVNLRSFDFAHRNSFRTPDSGKTVQLWYAPRLTELVNDTDVADGVDGWLEYVVVDCGLKCLQKEESDVSVFAGQKQMLIKRIEDAAEARDCANPPRMIDVYNGQGSYLTQGMKYCLVGNQIWLGQYQSDPFMWGRDAL
jgi:hypothetical protein